MKQLQLLLIQSPEAANACKEINIYKKNWTVSNYDNLNTGLRSLLAKMYPQYKTYPVADSMQDDEDFHARAHATANTLCA